jgi:DNA-binding NtrC family response regulator
VVDAKTQSFDESLDRYARVIVLHALRKCGGSRAGAAKLLGVTRRRFYRLCRRLGVDLVRTGAAQYRRALRG